MKGTIKRSTMAGGTAWMLHADNGEVYELEIGDDSLCKEGMRAEVEGAIQKNTMSITMTGPILRVKRFQPLP